MANLYSVSGLTLECNRPLPRLTAIPASRQRRGNETRSAGERLRVELGSFPPEILRTPEEEWQPYFESSFVNDRGEPELTIDLRSGGDLYRFLFAGGVGFLVDREGRRLWVRWTEGNAFEDVSNYLLGVVLGFVLRLRGVISLHASAVVIDGWAVAMAGPAGAGKSTSAAAFAQRGYPVLTDDVTVLEPVAGDFLVQPDRHELKLWPETAVMLFGSAEALPRHSPSWDKRYLDLARHGFPTARSPRPLAAVYLLAGEPLAPAESAIRELSGTDGFMALLANSLLSRLLDREMRIQEFDLLTRLCETVPVRRLHRSESGLPPLELCELVAGDFRRLPPRAAGAAVPGPAVGRDARRAAAGQRD